MWWCGVVSIFLIVSFPPPPLPCLPACCCGVAWCTEGRSRGGQTGQEPSPQRPALPGITGLYILSSIKAVKISCLRLLTRSIWKSMLSLVAWIRGRFSLLQRRLVHFVWQQGLVRLHSGVCRFFLWSQYLPHLGYKKRIHLMNPMGM